MYTLTALYRCFKQIFLKFFIFNFLQAVNITHQLIDLHKKYAPKIFKLMKQATKVPTMVNAPLWWIDPTDPVTFTIDSGEILRKQIGRKPLSVDCVNENMNIFIFL